MELIWITLHAKLSTRSSHPMGLLDVTGPSRRLPILLPCFHVTSLSTATSGLPTPLSTTTAASRGNHLAGSRVHDWNRMGRSRCRSRLRGLLGWGFLRGVAGGCSRRSRAMRSRSLTTNTCGRSFRSVRARLALQVDLQLGRLVLSLGDGS